MGLAAYSPGEFGEFVSSLDDLTGVLASLAEREGHAAGEALTRAIIVVAIRSFLLQEVLTPGVCTEDAVALILGMGAARGGVTGRPERPGPS